MFVTNNHALFYLWWKKNLVKHQKCEYIVMTMILDSYHEKVNMQVDLWVTEQCKTDDHTKSNKLEGNHLNDLN